MKAVVTGSAGFIGGRLVDELVGRGYTVTGVDRRARPDSPDYRHRCMDLADDRQIDDLTRVAAGADVVFHVAARPGVRGRGPGFQRARQRDNIVATRNLLRVVPRVVPIVVTSSSSVYGGSLGGVASKEDDLLRPQGGYARSKVVVENLCERRRDKGGLIGVVRPFTVAGEGQRPDMAFALWLEALRQGGPVRLFGSDDRSRDITDVRHVVEGLIRAGERRLNQTVNLGTGVGHRLIDMARALIEVSGLEGRILRQPVTPDEVDTTLADTSRCQRLLGFLPQTDLHDLLRRQVDATLPLPVLAVR